MNHSASLRAALGEVPVVVRESVALAPLTHVRIGGPSAFFVEALTLDGAAATVRTCRELDVPLHVLGGGSNLLVADGGVEGVVMTLSRLDSLVRDGTAIAAGAGVSLASLMRGTREIGLAGLEVLCGVPAVVGGAVAMNAVTRGGSTFDVLASVTIVDDTGEIRVLERGDLTPGYRDGGLGDFIVLERSSSCTKTTRRASMPASPIRCAAAMRPSPCLAAASGACSRTPTAPPPDSSSRPPAAS